MRLFHHFLTKTICTLGSSAHLKFLWETVVPHYATSHDYVMDSILAIAALHIASANPEDSQAYMCSALDYYTRALAGSRASIASGNMQDADACAVCSICILVAATAYSNNSQEKNARDPLDDILEKRRILKGTRFFMQGLDRASMHPLLEEWCFGDMDKGNDVEFPEEYRTHDVIYSTHQLINFRLNPKMESLHG
ncbi:hypothetical protein N7454_004412 [Penicillium verhagenii]|nr:hypothetical protein N7454_004412 [Penicillium verhagenii]